VIRFLADEQLPAAIVDALRAHHPQVDVITVQEADLAGSSDPALLAWAAAEGRVVLSYDVNTMTACAGDRIRRGAPLAGLILLSPLSAAGDVADDLALVAQACAPDEYRDRVAFGPFG
jgi:hypothetical protein